MLDRLSMTVPIVQAPMAGVATPALASVVSDAGGMGSIGVGATDVAGARAMIEETRARTDRPFNVNLFVHGTAVADAGREAAWLERLSPVFAEFGAMPPAALRMIYTSFADDPHMPTMLLEVRPPVVSFHFGLPRADIIAALRERGIVLLATATSLEEAQAIEAAGLDGIVAQGIEAGGHRGVFDPAAPDAMLGTVALTRLLVHRTTLPVIAAGGIMDGAGIAAALALGFTALAEHLADTAPPDYPSAYDAGKALHDAAKARGEHGFGAQWAGQGAPLARAMPATELMTVLAGELAAARATT